MKYNTYDEIEIELAKIQKRRDELTKEYDYLDTQEETPEVCKRLYQIHDEMKEQVESTIRLVINLLILRYQYMPVILENDSKKLELLEMLYSIIEQDSYLKIIKEEEINDIITFVDKEEFEMSKYCEHYSYLLSLK